MMRKILWRKSVRLEISICTVLGPPTPRTSDMALLSTRKLERSILRMVFPLTYQ